jgi:ADP-heptose:LPS heptosyltransferase
VRRGFIRAVVALLGRPDRSGVPDWGARPHRVLFLRHDRLGDMIVSTGLIHAIANAFPTLRLDVLASTTNADILAHEERIGHVYRFDRSRPLSWVPLVRTLRRARYDAVIDCMVFSPSVTTLLLMLASGARHRIGIGGRRNDAALTIPVPPTPGATHHIDHLAALGAPFGLAQHTTDWRPEIVLTADERARADRRWRELGATDGTRRLLVNISAGKGFRRWPDERYVAAIRHVRAHDPAIAIVIIGSPEDRERRERIAHECGVAVAATTLREALALVATSDLVFTPDTSIGHAASAFRKPAVIMFIARMAPLWGPYGVTAWPISSGDRTLATLALEPVLAALDEMLALPAPR